MKFEIEQLLENVRRAIAARNDELQRELQRRTVEVLDAYKVIAEFLGENQPTKNEKHVRVEYDENPDLMENYLGGVYDVTCNLCGGLRVVPVCDNPEVQKRIEAQAEARAEIRRQ